MKMIDTLGNKKSSKKKSSKNIKFRLKVRQAIDGKGSSVEVMVCAVKMF